MVYRGCFHFASKQLQPKGSNEVRTVSDPVVFSCYIASAVILVLAIIEAVKEFQQGKIWGGVIYILLAIAGVLFSVFITIWNKRNKKLLREGKKSG